jgi:cytochrome c-type biogenesis protein CcmF
MSQVWLLVALVSAGYASFVCLAGLVRPSPLLGRLGVLAGVVAFVTLSGAVITLSWALVTRDFGLDYVAHYASRHLPGRYALSALWVGQAGSLLLWAWLLAGLTVLFRVLPARDATLREVAFGVLTGFLTFLVAVMVFAADPLKPNLLVQKEGLGLSPLLQHPSMLIHPPVVFLAYSLWTVPFALATAALLLGRLDVAWAEMARPWALLAWTVLLAGLLLGAHWAYQELGWGGYWGWDPVENGSLLPWLTGTAFIHCLMAWRSRQCLKKMAVSLAFVTFGLCQFATFLTRSGIFSSVHAFSESPIGWLFLGLMVVLLILGCTLVVLRRADLAPQRAARSLLARETLILVSAILLLLLALVVMGGTLVGPISQLLVGRIVMLEPAFYNQILIPVGLLLLATTATVPLLRWGKGPGHSQRRVLAGSLLVAFVAVGIAYSGGGRHPVSLVVAGLFALTLSSLLGSWWLDAWRREPGRPWLGLLRSVQARGRQYAGYSVHLGFVILAVGITGSALGTQRQEMVLSEGEVIRWADRDIRYTRLEQREQPDKLIAEAVLEVSRAGSAPVTLRPARHLHLLQNEWTTEVDIHSTWTGDFYTILNAGLGDGKVALTLVENPMINWIWFGGFVAGLGALAASLPWGRRSANRAEVLDSGRQLVPVVDRQAA